MSNVGSVAMLRFAVVRRVPALVGLLPIFDLFARAENIIFCLCQAIKNELRIGQFDLAIVRHISTHVWQLTLPDFEQRINRTFAELKTR